MTAWAFDLVGNAVGCVAPDFGPFFVYFTVSIV